MRPRYLEIRNPLEKINFISNVIRDVNDQVEEIENIDKLIDSYPHIELYTIIGEYLKLKEWNQMILRKLDIADHFASNLEYVHSSENNKKIQRSLFFIAILSGFFGLFEMLNYFAGIR